MSIIEDTKKIFSDMERDIGVSYRQYRARELEILTGFATEEQDKEFRTWLNYYDGHPIVLEWSKQAEKAIKKFAERGIII